MLSCFFLSSRFLRGLHLAAFGYIGVGPEPQPTSPEGRAVRRLDLPFGDPAIERPKGHQEKTCQDNIGNYKELTAKVEDAAWLRNHECA